MTDQLLTLNPRKRQKRPAMRRSGATSGRRAERNRQRRDRAILRLWRSGWTGKRIAAHLHITPTIVGNVTHKHGATRGARVSPRQGGARDAAWESYRVYFWRVMDSLFRQVDAHGGTCPPYITIPKPADEFQRGHVMQTIDWWARQAFDLPTIEVRTE